MKNAACDRTCSSSKHVVDFGGGGLLDVVVNRSFGDVSVRLGRGDGTLGPQIGCGMAVSRVSVTMSA